MPELPPLPPIATSPLSVVLPAWNAAASLKDVLAGWTACLESLAREYEIILVDDGSRDETPALAEELAGSNPRLRVLRHTERQGFGAALRTGLAAAKLPLLCTATCDRQYRPADLSRLLEIIDQVHLAAGCRDWQPRPAWARGLGGVYRAAVRVLFGVPLEPRPCWLGRHGWRRRWVARWLFGVRIHDVDCAFRLYRREVFTRLPIQSDSAFALVEILAKANFLGCVMTDIRVAYTPPAGAAVVDPHDDPRQRREAWRLFQHPDFGPPFLPESAPSAGLPSSVG